MRFDFVLLLVFLSISMEAVFAQVIHPQVYEAIKKNPNSFHQVYIALKEYPDLEEIHEQMVFQRMDPHSRSSYLRSLLMENAEASQVKSVSKLILAGESVDAESIRSLWICNSIYARVKGNFISVIAQWPEVEGIYPMIEATYDAVHANLAAPLAPNGSEPGLRAIGAPELWRLGYTGAGTKAVIFDTGGDWDHPAIREKFYGLHVPIERAWSAPGSLPLDADGHGTHVIGTICGLDRSTNDTIGVAFNAMWIAAPVQFGNAVQQPIPVLDFLSNMQFAVDPNGDGTDLPDVINNSWSGGNYIDCAGNTPFSRTVRAAEVAGIAVVWAAGNAGPEPLTIRGYQTNNHHLLTGFAVGATLPNFPFTIAPFSSRGPSLCGGSGPLAIKPEVSAPGVGIRSCLPGNRYAALNGTSMACPHVAGAVLLLKEAFPYLAGEDILMALYMSARDLGEAGEDNDYGRGIIHVYDAYEYLIHQGHQPEPPKIMDYDLLVSSISRDKSVDCNSNLGIKILCENVGLQTIYSATFQIEVSNNEEVCSSIITWEGEADSGQRFEVAFPEDLCLNFKLGDFYLPGHYEINVNVQQVNNQDDQNPFNNKTRLPVLINIDRPTSVSVDGLDDTYGCAGTTVRLTARHDGPGQIEWYRFPDFTNSLHIGNEYITTIHGKSQRWLIKPVISGIGIVDDLSEGIANDIPSQGTGLFFDVYEYLRLRSVKVVAPRQGLLNFQICNPQGVCTNYSRILRSGVNIISIDQQLTPGQGWAIRRTSNIQLQYSTSNLNFPYHYENLLSITGSDHPTQAYLFFYDWRLEFTHPCPVEPIELKLWSAIEPSSAKIMMPDTLIISVGEPFEPVFEFKRIAFWKMDFGDGNISTSLNPKHYYENPGTYLVTLTGWSSDVCMDIDQKVVRVLSQDEINTQTLDLSIEPDILLSPNPGNQFLNISSRDSSVSSHFKSIKLRSIMGEVHYENSDANVQGNLVIPTGSLKPGIYFVEIENANRIFRYKWIKID